MANKVCSAAEEGPNVQLVRQQLEDLPDNIRASWQAFKEAKLNRINEQNKVGVGWGVVLWAEGAMQSVKRVREWVIRRATRVCSHWIC